mmetsp:Transcript_6406/g.24070  ORF Transcript_6406/g.24070 Transcript_6406/m.24070 type:complete len:107 (+) Transcript_6406:373-693(+)
MRVFGVFYGGTINARQCCQQLARIRKPIDINLYINPDAQQAPCFLYISLTLNAGALEPQGAHPPFTGTHHEPNIQESPQITTRRYNQNSHCSGVSSELIQIDLAAR